MDLINNLKLNPESLNKLSIAIQTFYNKVSVIKINNISDNEYAEVLYIIDHAIPDMKCFITNYMALNIFPKDIEYQLLYNLTRTVEGYTKETLILNLAILLQDLMLIVSKCQALKIRAEDKYGL